MRFWMHILRGAAITPRTEGGYYDNKTGGTCAWGAAVFSMHGGKVGWRCEDSGKATLFDLPYGVEAPHIQGEVNRMCPVCGADTRMLKTGLVPHLNDFHHLSRPAIAYLMYFKERELSGADPKDDEAFEQIFGPLREMDHGIEEAIGVPAKAIV